MYKEIGGKNEKTHDIKENIPTMANKMKWLKKETAE